MYHSKLGRNNYYCTQILCQLGFLSTWNRKHSGNKSKKHLLKGYWEITDLPGFKRGTSISFPCLFFDRLNLAKIIPVLFNWCDCPH